MELTTEQFEALPFPKGAKVFPCYQQSIKLIDNKLVAKRIIGKINSEDLEVQYGKANDSFVFPIEKLYLDKVYSGFIMNYIDGQDAIAVSFNDFETFIDLIEKVKKDLEVLTDNKIVAGDLHLHNCLFDTQFRFIDTNAYRLYSDFSEEKIISRNYRLLNCFFEMQLFKKFYHIFSLVVRSGKKEYLIKLYDRLYSPVCPIFFTDFLSELMELEKVKTVTEFSEKIKKYV